jgi:hypothetical protein
VNDTRFAHLPILIETEKSPASGRAGQIALDPLDVRNLETLRSLRSVPTNGARRPSTVTRG